MELASPLHKTAPDWQSAPGPSVLGPKWEGVRTLRPLCTHIALLSSNTQSLPLDTVAFLFSHSPHATTP